MKNIIKFLLVASCLFNSAWANKETEVVVLFTPGGVNDIVGRAVSEYFIKNKLESVVVNRPGGDGIIGIQYAQSRPNAVFVANAGSTVFNRVLKQRLPYDMEKDFSLVVPIASVPSSLIVNSQSRIKNMSEFITTAKTRNLNCGTSNKGTEMALRTLLKSLDLPNVAVIPYKSTSQIMTDLLGGTIDCTMEPISSFVQHHESGKVIIIANASDRPYAKLKNIPFVSQWVPNFKFESWFGIAIPNTQDKSRRDQYVKLLSVIDKDPDYVKTITDAGMMVNTPSARPEEWYGREYIKWEAIRHRLNIDKQE